MRRTYHSSNPIFTCSVKKGRHKMANPGPRKTTPRQTPDAYAPHCQSYSDYITHNYPPQGDTTASGGYSSPKNVWSDRAQRGNATNIGTYRPRAQSDTNVDQMKKGGKPLRDQFDDSELGRELEARREHERQCRGGVKSTE
ncbi:hypothetical protein DXG03_001588 [Asterophora parasitica]|uniref:Uncharacterized protein n=1 Tax=Asterophora parasitica TaxID=117018 RepID=A0A9P7G9R3_9AGAR|nr:hypothetical protein DXG03_001588 [Asterophora parasitica]